MARKPTCLLEAEGHGPPTTDRAAFSTPHRQEHPGDEPAARRPDPSGGEVSPTRLLAITMAAVFCGEFAIMALLHVLPGMPFRDEALLDAGLLSVLAFPVLYVFTFRPLLRQIAERRQAQEALQAAHDKLDARVQERTAELAEANDALRRERNFVDAVVETAGALVVVLDPEGRIVRFNQACERTSGYTFDEVKGQVFSPLLIPPEEVEGVTEAFRRLSSGDFPNQYRNHWLARDGSRRYISWANTAIVDADGNVEFVVGTGLDITEHTAAEALIHASLKEKEVLLKEIHHRVKNNLQIIASMLNLQARHVLDERALAPLRESQNRIRTLALIHEKLYRSEDLAHIPFRDYVQDLASSVIASFSRGHATISVVVDIEEVALGIDTAIPVALIINELVCNSVKHAFAGAPGGTITISLKSTATGRYRLVVADNGSGLPPDFESRRSTSLGLQAVDVLTTQLGGSVTPCNDNGARFEIVFGKAE